MTRIFILLQAAAPPPEASGWDSIKNLLPIVLIIVVFWLFLIRPQQKKMKDEKKFREAIQQGDKVITIGGIHGKIVSIQDTTFIIEVEGGVKLKIERSAVSMNATAASAVEKK